MAAEKEMNKVRKKEESGVWGNMQPRRRMLGEPVIRSNGPALWSAPPAVTLTVPCLPNIRAPGAPFPYIQVSGEVVESENYHSGLWRGHLKTKKATQTIAL